MKKLLLFLFVSLAFIGSTYAASRAGTALTYGFGSVAIAAGLGFVLFILIKPKKDTEKKKAVYYGRLLLAYSLWASTAAVFPRFLIWPDINTFLLWLVPSIVFGIIAYVIGSAYGASKKSAVELAKKTKTITKSVIEKQSDKSIKKPQESSIVKQPIKTITPIKSNTTKQEDEPIDKFITNTITPNDSLMNKENDEVYYLIATKEVEDENINQALWAKCMAIHLGDNHKSKYEYINRRVKQLDEEAKAAKDKAIADAKAAEEKKIEDAKAAKEKAIADAKAAKEKEIADAKAAEEKKLEEAARKKRFAEAEEKRRAENLKATIQMAIADAKAAKEKEIEDAKAAIKEREARVKALREKKIADAKAAEALKEKEIEDAKAAIKEREARVKALREKKIADAKAAEEKKKADAEEKRRAVAFAVKAAKEKEIEDVKAAEEKKKALEKAGYDFISASNLYNSGHFELAFNKFKQSARGGSYQAQEQLANMFENGLGTDQDYKAALEWYEEAYKLNPLVTNNKVNSLKEKIEEEKNRKDKASNSPAFQKKADKP